MSLRKGVKGRQLSHREKSLSELRNLVKANNTKTLNKEGLSLQDAHYPHEIHDTT